MLIEWSMRKKGNKSKATYDENITTLIMVAFTAVDRVSDIIPRSTASQFARPLQEAEDACVALVQTVIADETVYMKE